MMNLIKKLISAVFLFSFLFASSAAIAELYEWQDEKGDIHIVDDILLVPTKYKDKVRVIKTKPSKQAPSDQQNIKAPSPPSQEQEELYGDYPLSWWTEQFVIKKRGINDLEQSIEEQKSFILSYERSRQILSKIYSEEDIKKYESYKKNLPKDEEQLSKLKSELEELKRKARAVGVPREIID